MDKPAGNERSLGRYIITGPLAEGGMGVAWMAREAGSRTPVVIKSVLAGGVASAEVEHLRKRLRREFQILVRLEHDNIVRALDWLEEAGEVYLVLEFVEGQNMARWFAGAPPLIERISVMRDIAAAVAHAHEHGVIHRDLKPLNVIVSARPRPKVLDFGLGRADVFSLGLLLARSLGLRLPFSARSTTEVYSRLVSPEAISLDPWLPADLRDALAPAAARGPPRLAQDRGWTRAAHPAVPGRVAGGREPGPLSGQRAHLSAARSR